MYLDHGLARQVGPCFHWIVDSNCLYVMSLVNRSAGLSADGQYLQEVKTDWISLTRLLMNGLSFYCWLSTEQLILRDVIINTQSLTASTAAISSSLGINTVFRGIFWI